MRLPDIKNFKLNDWQPEAFKQWQDLIYSLGQQVAGKHTKGFEEKVAEIKGWNGNCYDRDFNEFLDDRLALRALTWLWVSDTAFRKRFFKNEMLEHLLRKKTWLGNLVVIELISLYLKEYDKLDIEAGNESPKILNKLRNLIKSQLAIFSKRKAVRRKNPKNMAVEKNIIDAFIHHKDMLISDSSALKTSSYAVKYNLDLQDLFNRIGLKGFDDGRFADQCRFLFYIQRIRKLKEGRWDDVLMEIRKKDVANAMYEGKKLLGHLAIELLIDKVKGTPTDDWLETIIEIAGDPRVANTATNYRKWWLPIGQEKIAKVRGWLAKEDLKLFLKAVDEYGKLAGDKDLLRMFPARKKFLEGLFEQGLVRNARLMLGTEAAGYVKKALDKDYQINHILLTGGLKDKAVIYLDCSNFYIVEGSHNFKIWVYLAKPTNIFDSYSPNFSLEYSDLTSSVIKSYLTKFPNWPYVGVTHNNNWLNNVIDFLYTNGRKVELEDIMSKVDYPKYLERYGQPYLKKSKFN